MCSLKYEIIKNDAFILHYEIHSFGRLLSIEWKLFFTLDGAIKKKIIRPRILSKSRHDDTIIRFRLKSLNYCSKIVFFSPSRFSRIRAFERLCVESLSMFHNSDESEDN